MDGWIKLYRKLLENPIFQNEKLLKIFIWCLLKASHKEYKQLVGLQEVILQPGQFIYGRLKDAEELKINPSTLKKYMKWLADNQIIAVKSTNKFSIISITNWAFYQVEENGEYQQNTNKIPTKYQQSTTNKNVKNEKNNIYTPEFESWYKSWPRASAKQDSFKNFEKARKKHGLEFILMCSKNYLDYFRSLPEKDQGYPYQSNNFFGQKAYYLDYTEPKATSGDAAKDILGDDIIICN